MRNFDVLKQLARRQTVDEREEKYGLNWHGKRRARQLALTPSTGTLRPCPEDSVDWDTTQNLMIEGDNLEVLKLLQKCYAGKVKLIYIDPPYNTGKDFVYPDNFQDNIKNYLELTGQVDEAGRRSAATPKPAGVSYRLAEHDVSAAEAGAESAARRWGDFRQHRRQRELHNLRRICDEIFGEENFVANLSGKERMASSNSTNHAFCDARIYSVLRARASDLEQASNAIGREHRDDRYKCNDSDEVRGEWLRAYNR